jgi:glycosyltransferase involved in cell wall biosynthesis
MINPIKKAALSVLYNPTIIAVARKTLRHFPSVEEHVRVYNYFLKKKLADKHAIPIASYGKRAIATASIPTKQLMIDISQLVVHDWRTGIQRVVRGLLQELLSQTYPAYLVKAVYADAAGQIRHANKFTKELLGKTESSTEDHLVEIHSGDIFYCPDLHLNYPFATLAFLRDEGLRIIFTVYDIIGITREGLFPRAYQLAFTDWFAGVMTVADAIVCDSRSVADEVRNWLQDHPGQRTRPLPIGYFHLGADIEASHPSRGPEGEGAEAIAACQSRPTLLMVGTLEPRKGHAQALAAMEVLWKEGVDVNLVIVGKEGWRTQRLARQLRRHPERNRRLFWLEKASDALLMQMYAQSTALFAASYAEGFGLPLIEAARQGLPIIARDIPVFREVAGENAFYFPDTDSAALAESLRHWLRLNAEGKTPQSKDMPYLTWAQSTRQLLHVILENDWYTTYEPADPPSPGR